MAGKGEAFSGGQPSQSPGPQQAGPQASPLGGRNRDKTTEEKRKGTAGCYESSDPEKMQHRVNATLSAAFLQGSMARERPPFGRGPQTGGSPVTGFDSSFGRPEPGTSLKLLEVEGVRGSRPYYPRVTDAVNCPSRPLTRLHRHGVALSTPEKSAGSLLETQVVNPWVLIREESCLANCSSSTAPAPSVALPVRRHQGGIDTGEVLRNLSDSGLALACQWWRNGCLRIRWTPSPHLPGPRSGRPLMVYSKKDRRRAGGACGRGVPVQGGVGNPQVSLHRPGVFHTSGRIHGPIYYRGSESSPIPWAR